MRGGKKAFIHTKQKRHQYLQPLETGKQNHFLGVIRPSLRLPGRVDVLFAQVVTDFLSDVSVDLDQSVHGLIPNLQ